MKAEPPLALEGSSGGAGRPFHGLALALAGLHAVLALLVFEPTLFAGGDNAGYLILGDALRSGDGYRDLYLPGAPLHAKYPPVLPGLLALLGWLGGVQLFKLAMVACTAITVWLTALVGRRLVGEGPALFAAALLAINPTLIEYGHYILSEAPFTLLVMLALAGYLRDDRAGTWIAVLASVGAFLTRTAGLTLLLALPVAWLLRKSTRRAAMAGAAGLVAMSGWGLYQAWAAPEQASYLQELVMRDPYDPAAGTLGPAGLLARAAINLWAYVSRVVPQTSFGVEGPPGAGWTALAIAFCGLALFGWARKARQAPGASELFVLLYTALLAVWPDVWTDRRFLLPLVPLLGVFGFGAASHLGGGHVKRWGPAALLILTGLPAVSWVVGRIPERTACLASYRTGAPCDAPAFASFYAAARWAAENTPPAAVIANRKPRLFYWYSQRQGDLYAYSGDPEAVLRGLDSMGAGYVVVDQVSGTTLRYLVPAIQTHPERFERVYEGGEPPTFILRLLPRPANAQ